MKTKTNHLTEEAIERYRAGEPEAEAVRHVRECDHCRARLCDERLLDTLIAHSLSDTNPPSQVSHPATELLLEFVEGGLDALSASRLESHVKQCMRCAARILGLQQAGQEAPTLEPPTALVEHVRKQVIASRPPRRNLGQLFVETLDRLALQVIYRPSAAQAGYAPLQARLAAAAPSGVIQKPDASSLPPVTLTSGAVRLAIQATREGVGELLAISAVDVATGEVVSGLTLSIEATPGDTIAARTDDQGSCHLPVPQGKSHLIIGTEPPGAIELNR